MPTTFRHWFHLTLLALLLGGAQAGAALPVEVKLSSGQLAEGELSLTAAQRTSQWLGPIMSPLYSLFGGDFYHEFTRPSGVKRLQFEFEGALREVKLDALQVEWVLYLLGHLDRRNLWAVPISYDVWRVGTIAKLQVVLDARGELSDIHTYVDFDRAPSSWSLHPSKKLRRVVSKSQLWRGMNEEPRTLGFELALGIGTDTPLLLETKERLIPVRVLKINSGTAWVATQLQWNSLFQENSNRLSVFEVDGHRLLVADKYHVRRLSYEAPELLEKETTLLKAHFDYRDSNSIREDVFTPTPFWSEFKKAFQQGSGMLRGDQIHCGHVITLFQE